MRSSRRNFIRNSFITGAGLPIAASNILASGILGSEFKHVLQRKPDKKFKILILGGTSFLGPHQIKYALDRGHSITIFNRGKTVPTINKEVFDQVEHLVGDRENNLEALKNRKWDAVIDNSGRKVHWTEDTAALLHENVGTYLYVSSVSVYYPYIGEDYSESRSLVLEVPKDVSEDQKYEYEYGVMKANSELAAEKYFGSSRTISVRPTFMIGPGDPYDRFNHWSVRFNQGGELFIPGKANDQVQYIDVRDAASFMIHLIEQQASGSFNAVGPASITGMHQFVHGAHGAFNTEVDFVYCEDYAFLKANELIFMAPWILPEDIYYGITKASTVKAKANGIQYRPLADTMRDLHHWFYSDPSVEERRMALIKGPISYLDMEKTWIKKWKNK
jgi:2'-hydroxyisoflavone reductase